MKIEECQPWKMAGAASTFEYSGKSIVLKIEICHWNHEWKLDPVKRKRSTKYSM